MRKKDGVRYYYSGCQNEERKENQEVESKETPKKFKIKELIRQYRPEE